MALLTPECIDEILSLTGIEKLPSVFVETGTYHGGTLKQMLDMFNCLYSIELSDKHYNKAVRRFGDIEKVNLLHGDSAELMSKVGKEIKEPAVFFLDAHYSGAGTTRGEKPRQFCMRSNP